MIDTLIAADILKFAALNYTVVKNEGDDILWFQDESDGYSAEEVIEHYLELTTPNHG